jgi:predicted nicotinamide N-methyase
MLPRLASAVACAVLLTLVAPTAAHAASRTFVDGAGDVWELQDQPSPVPDRDQGDIARTTLTHGAHRVVVRTRFVELNRVGRIFIFTQLRTNTGQVRGLSLTARPNHYRGRAVLETRRGTTVKCAIGRRIDYARNVATVSVPRRCLDNPRTVQAKFGVATFMGQRAFADNPINDGPTNRLPPYTAPVRHG